MKVQWAFEEANTVNCRPRAVLFSAGFISRQTLTASARLSDTDYARD